MAGVTLELGDDADAGEAAVDPRHEDDLAVGADLVESRVGLRRAELERRTPCPGARSLRRAR
jgi:hypothetical protein